MTSTVFTDYVTPIPASWLNDVNTAVYTTLPTLQPITTATQKTSSTGSVIISAGTTAQRDAVGLNTYLRKNIDTPTAAILEHYNGTSWITVSDSSNSVLLTTNQSIAGIKTFTSPVGVASAVASGDALRQDQVGIRPQNSQSTAYTTVLNDAYQSIVHPSSDTTARTFTIAANASVAYALGTLIYFDNQTSAGVLTIACNDTLKVIGDASATTLVLSDGEMAFAYKETSTSWRAGKLSRGIRLNTVVTTTSGTAVDWVIPVGAKRLIFTYNQFSATGGTYTPQLRIGTGGTPDTTGYVGGYGYVYTTNNAFATAVTNGIPIGVASTNQVHSGIMILELHDSATNTWAFSGTTFNTTATVTAEFQAGIKPVAGIVNILRFTTVEGLTFNTGSVNLTIET